MQGGEESFVGGQEPLPWWPDGGGLGMRWLWWEGVGLLTLRPASLPTSPSPSHPFPPFSLSSYFPPRDPWMGWVQSDEPRVQWWSSGRQHDAPCHVWRSFKLRRFSIAI